MTDASTFGLKLDSAPGREESSSKTSAATFGLAISPKPSTSEDYTGSILPLRKDASGLHLAIPTSISEPIEGAVQGGKRLFGIDEEGKNPLRPPSPEIMSATAAFGGLPLRAGEGRVGGVSASPTMREARPVALEARSAGYVLPPSAINEKPGFISSVIAGYSGRIKTQQAASERNQAVTNSLAHKALGVPEDVSFSDQVFNSIRAKAGQAYEAVKTAIPLVSSTPSYEAALNMIGGANSHAAQLFPTIIKNPQIEQMVAELKAVPVMPTPVAVELVKELRFNASGNLKAIGDPSKHALGLAQRQAADAVDSLMEQNLAKARFPNLVRLYREARQLIARSYDVELATNPATGDVNARGIARLAAKGRPLTGELDTIANVAAAFPKAMQAPAGFGHEEPYSVFDFAGGTAAVTSGHPAAIGAVLLRPVARQAMLSETGQNILARQRMKASPISKAENLQRSFPAGVLGATSPLDQAAQQ